PASGPHHAHRPTQPQTTSLSRPATPTETARLASSLEPCCPGKDLWLIDGRLVLFHWFTGDGEWAGHEFNEDSATVKMVIAAFEAV
ncbi:DUF6879 family protein, partial [Streptomyces sp. NPDC088729]|uniref:DUF6879 family protein n=1 Tax=Streptomyces sp. NPDC088729 TaxID=3365876 RepID=UPI003812A035